MEKYEGTLLNFNSDFIPNIGQELLLVSSLERPKETSFSFPFVNNSGSYILDRFPSEDFSIRFSSKLFETEEVLFVIQKLDLFSSPSTHDES